MRRGPSEEGPLLPALLEGAIAADAVVPGPVDPHPLDHGDGPTAVDVPAVHVAYATGDVAVAVVVPVEHGASRAVVVVVTRSVEMPRRRSVGRDRPQLIDGEHVSPRRRA